MKRYSILYDLDDPRIIAFLFCDERATLYHHPAWLKAISKTFNHTAFYLILEGEQKNILGIVPFIFIKSNIFDNRIVSLPFSTYCNPLLPADEINEVISFLINTFGNKLHIDLRTTINLRNELNSFSCIENYITHYLELKSDIQKTFDSFHPRSVRSSIRRAEKNNLTIDFGNSESNLNVFYNLEAHLRKRLGLPPLPFSFFRNIYQELKPLNLISLPVVKKDNLPIAAGFILNFKNTYYLEYTASDRTKLNLYPNHKLIWEVIKLAQNNGASIVDWGRTSADNESLIIFKEKWNTRKNSIYNFVYPACSKIKRKQGSLNKYLMNINRVLPVSLLKIEGKIIYPHLS